MTSRTGALALLAQITASITMSATATATAQAPALTAAAELLDPVRGDNAMWSLLEMRDQAVGPLLEALASTLAREPVSWSLAGEQIHLLGLLGRDAARALPALTARLRTARPVLRESLVWAIGEIAPFAHQPAQNDAWSALEASATADDGRIPLAKIGLASADAERVVELAAFTGEPYGIAAAEQVPDLVGVLDPSAIARLRAQAVANWGKLGEAHKRAALALERAFLATAPAREEAVFACANLLQHQDPRVRLDAITRLATMGPLAAAAAPYLANALRDGSLRVAHGAAMLLASFGAEALGARDALAEAATRPGLERVAQAALRALARNAERDVETKSPGERAVQAFVTGDADARAALVPDLVRAGASVVEPLERELWAQPFDPTRADLRDAIVGVLLRLDTAAARSLTAMFWWLDQTPRDHPLRNEMLAMLARIGPVAFEHQPKVLQRIAAWWQADERALEAALRSMCRSEQQLREALVSWNPRMLVAAARCLADRASLEGDTVDSLWAIVASDPDHFVGVERRRARATVASVALPHLGEATRRLAAWKLLAADGTLDEQRATAARLRDGGVRDPELWRTIAASDDPAVREFARPTRDR